MTLLVAVLSCHGANGQRRVALPPVSGGNRVPINMTPSRMAFSRGGTELVYAVGNHLVIWSINDRKEVRLPDQHFGDAPGDFIRMLVMSPDGNWLSTGDHRGTINLWKWKSEVDQMTATEIAPPVETDPEAQYLGYSTWCAFSHDGRMLGWASLQSAAPNNDREFVIHLTELPSVQELGIIRWDYDMKKEAPVDIAWSQDDKSIQLAHSFRHRTRASCELRSWQVSTREPIKSADRSFPLVALGVPFSFRAEGKYLAFSNSLDGTLQLLELSSGRIQAFPATTRTRLTAWQEEYVISPDGRFMAVGQLDRAPINQPPLAVIWDLQERAIVARLPHEGAVQVFPGAFSPDNKYLATVVRNIWDTAPDPDETRATHFIWDLSPETGTEASNHSRP